MTKQEIIPDKFYFVRVSRAENITVAQAVTWQNEIRFYICGSEETWDYGDFLEIIRQIPSPRQKRS